MAINPGRGEIWRVDFEPVVGSETGKLPSVRSHQREQPGAAARASCGANHRVAAGICGLLMDDAA